MDNLSYFVSLFPSQLQTMINGIDNAAKRLINEIRLRKGRVIVIYIADKCFFFDVTGSLTKKYSPQCIKISDDDFEYICDRLCNNSYHTNMSSMINGYITVKNGSRVGIASSAVLKGNEVSSVKDITSLNIRISHEYMDCSKRIIDIINKGSLHNIIVASSPGCGKTTFLRDYARMISNGYLGEYKKVCIVDERREISSGFDVGINTDTLINFSKADGIEIATRTLSPDLIICDEIGTEKELNAISTGFSSGIKFAVSVHLSECDELLSNKIMLGLLNSDRFDYIVILKHYTDEFEIIDIREIKSENSRNDIDYPFFYLN